MYVYMRVTLYKYSIYTLVQRKGGGLNWARVERGWESVECMIWWRDGERLIAAAASIASAAAAPEPQIMCPSTYYYYTCITHMNIVRIHTRQPLTHTHAHIIVNDTFVRTIRASSTLWLFVCGRARMNESVRVRMVVDVSQRKHIIWISARFGMADKLPNTKTQNIIK